MNAFYWICFCFFFDISTAQVISVVCYDTYLFIKLLITRKLPVIAQICLPVFACCQRSSSDFLQQTEASAWIQLIKEKLSYFRIVWAVSIYSLNFSKYSPLQISFNLCTHKKYVIFIQFWLGVQDSHLGGLSPPLPMPGAGPDMHRIGK